MDFWPCRISIYRWEFEFRKSRYTSNFNLVLSVSLRVILRVYMILFVGWGGRSHLQ